MRFAQLAPSFRRAERLNGNISYRRLSSPSFLHNVFDQIEVPGETSSRAVKSAGIYRSCELIKAKTFDLMWFTAR